MASDAFIGDIFMFAGSFAMRNTAACNGQLIPIAQNTALFSILGTFYGGNGTTTFALPNLQGRCPVMPGSSTPTSVPIPLGEMGGSETVTLTQNELPVHSHNGQIQAAMETGGNAVTASPIGSLPGNTSQTQLYATAPGSGSMAPMTTNLTSPTSIAGSNNPHNNMQPFLTVTFVIATRGIFPARN